MAVLKYTQVLMLVLLMAGVCPVAAEDGYFNGNPTVMDATGAEHPKMQNCQRIISLAPNLTEIAYYVGLGDTMVGRTDYCNYPPEAADLPSIGGFVDASLEKIVQLNPDLVLAYQGNSLELIEQLRHLRIRVLVFDEAHHLKDILDDMVALVEVASADPADHLDPIQNWDSQLKELEQIQQPDNSRNGVAEPTVFFGYPGETSISCGKESFLNDLIELAGGRNICQGLRESWPSVSTEFIIAANPDLIISASSCTGGQSRSEATEEITADLQNRAAWKTLSAVEAGRVFVFDSDVLLRPGPRILEAGFELAGYIEAFKALK